MKLLLEVTTFNDNFFFGVIWQCPIFLKPVVKFLYFVSEDKLQILISIKYKMALKDKVDEPVGVNHYIGGLLSRVKCRQKHSLIAYAENGDMKKVQEKLKAGAVPSANAFIASAGVGSWELFELLFTKCQQNNSYVDINSREEYCPFRRGYCYGNTSLHEAARDNNLLMVEKLLANGCVLWQM